MLLLIEAWWGCLMDARPSDVDADEVVDRGRGPWCHDC